MEEKDRSSEKTKFIGLSVCKTKRKKQKGEQKKKNPSALEGKEEKNSKIERRQFNHTKTMK